MNYEDIVIAYTNAQDDILHEMIGYIDPETRKKVPGIFDKLLKMINFEALAEDPEAEMELFVDRFMPYYAFFLRQSALVAADYENLLRK